MKALVLVLFFAATSASALTPINKGPGGTKPTSPIKKPVPPLFAEPDDVVELNPYDESTGQVLRALENSPDFLAPKYAGSPFADLLQDVAGGCYRTDCRLYVYISLSERPQKAHVYYDGNLLASWLVSSGTSKHPTRTWDGHPGGLIAVDYYDSKKYPEGDYMGLGNMPYAMFYSGGFALHGTTTGAFKKLGQPASHGCVRMHPEDAYYLNLIVREVGRNQTWFHIVP